MNQDFRARYAEETREFERRMENLQWTFRRSRMFLPMMGFSTASCVCLVGVGIGAPIMNTHPVLSNAVFASTAGIAVGLAAGCVVSNTLEMLADSLHEWYGHEYGQITRLIGVGVGGASVITGALSSLGVLNLGAAIFAPVFFVSFGLTLGGTCFYQWYVRRRSTECVQSMRRVGDYIRNLYQECGEKAYQTWEVFKYMQRDTIRIPQKVAIAIMRCASSDGRLRLFTTYMDSLYH